jgi:hypothetical protein
MDIYDELEQLVPQERKEAFLRVARQLKEFGEHNPELLRIVEAMGFLSLYTVELPKRLSDTFGQAQAQFISELKALHAERAASQVALNANFDQKLTALQQAAQSADSLACQLSFPDADKIKASAESNAQTAQTIANAASVINRRLAAFRVWHLIVFTVVAILYFAGGAWLLQRDHHRVQSTIYQRVAARTAQALARIQPDELRQHVQALKDLLDLGVHFSLSHDIVSGDIVLTLEGRDGVTLYYPREANGKYYINVSQ